MSIEKYNISLKRDVLRINSAGKLSTKKFPKNITTSNKFIKETEERYLIRVSTPLENSITTAYNKFSEITNVLAEELYCENELIWPLENYLTQAQDIDLYTRIDISFADELLQELAKENKKFKYKDDEFYYRIKSNIANFKAIKTVCGNIREIPSDIKLAIYNIPLNADSPYGITMDTVRFLVAVIFLGLELELEKSNNSEKLKEKADKDVFTTLKHVDKEYNLKAEEIIEKYKDIYKQIQKEEYIPEKFNNKKAIMLATKNMKFFHSNRYTIAGYEGLVAESKVIIKDALSQGVDYSVLNAAKSVVQLGRGKHKEFVIEGNKTDRDNYIFPIVTDDKLIAKNVMKEAGVNVPKAILLTSDMTDVDIDEAMEEYYSKKIVVKPRNTNYGTGITVFAGKATKTQIKDAIHYAFEFDDNVLIEEYVKGMEYRFLVVDGKCLSIVNRRPASVVGDGESTILDLINAKNKEDWHALTGCPVKKDKPVHEYLKTQGLTLDSVIPKGKRVFLRTNSNCSTGGESVVYTNVMPAKFKHIAEKAANAFDAKICGVDIIIEDLKKDTYAIIEINDNPGYSINEWPYEGKGEKIGISILKLLGLTK